MKNDDKICKPVEPLELEVKLTGNDCKHDSVYGDPRHGGICVVCNAHLTAREMQSHRQFGLLSDSSKVFNSSKFGASKVNERKE